MACAIVSHNSDYQLRKQAQRRVVSTFVQLLQSKIIVLILFCDAYSLNTFIVALFLFISRTPPVQITSTIIHIPHYKQYRFYLRSFQSLPTRFPCLRRISSVISSPQCNKVCRITGLTLASETWVKPPAAKILLQSWERNLPFGPALFSHRPICLSSSVHRLP